MDLSSLASLKKELQTLSPGQLADLCLRLARYKKENKELLHYLLFEAHDEDGYIAEVKKEMEKQFAEMNSTNIYYVKKSVRKILRYANKHIKYSGLPLTAVEILIFFCAQVKKLPVRMESSTALGNLYDAQLKKIDKALSSLHEDIQYDYRKETDALARSR